jgi:hypothetical protein
MGLHDPFEYLRTYNTSYGWKKGRESKCQFDSQPLKVKNRPELLVCRWRATYLWKNVDKGYNFSLDLTSIKGLHEKLWTSKVAKVPILGISKLLTWEYQEKWHLGVALMASHKEYYKGEGGGFPQVQTMVNLMSSCMLVIRPCTKSVPTMC